MAHSYGMGFQSLHVHAHVFPAADRNRVSGGVSLGLGNAIMSEGARVDGRPLSRKGRVIPKPIQGIYVL